MKITPQTAPTGSRVLIRMFGYKDPLEEVRVAEWSPEKRLKLKYPHGAERWYENANELFEMVEVLPLAPPDEN